MTGSESLIPLSDYARESRLRLTPSLRCAESTARANKRMSTKKRFDRYLYRKYDEQAKQAARALLSRSGFVVVDNPDKYAADLIAQKGDEPSFFVEVEVKDVWKGDTFPYDSLQIPERKKKFAVHRTVFMIWNSEINHCASFWSDSVWGSELKVIPNKRGPEGEKFFQIPLSKIKFSKL